MKIGFALLAFSAAQEAETEAQRVDTQPSLFDILIAQKTGLQLFVKIADKTDIKI